MNGVGEGLYKGVGSNYRWVMGGCEGGLMIVDSCCGRHKRAGEVSH